jgi:hypothetical protein
MSIDIAAVPRGVVLMDNDGSALSFELVYKWDP